MLRNRLLILLGGCLLATSAAWADDVGYIDCQNHPEDTKVLGKAGKTSDVVTAMPCGERFTILLSGFFFTRIQTKDGREGFVYSNLISHDRSATSVQQPVRAPASTPISNVPATTATLAQAKLTTSAQPQPAAAQPVAARAPAPAPTSSVLATTATLAQAKLTTSVQPPPAAAQPAAARAPAPTSSVPAATATVVQPKAATPVQPQPAAVQPVPAPARAATSSVAATTATVVQPEPSPPPQPEPAPAQSAAHPPRSKAAKTGLERSIPSTRKQPLVELFGGYAFVRLDNGGGYRSNLNGALGAFGWNVKPWLQIVADTSYNFVTVSGTKTVLYGNHFGPRYTHRGRNKWGVTPFVEVLFGGTRADITVSGTGGYNTSDNSLSIKAGGGLNINPSRHFEIRLFDFDYYRTSFGLNSHQNNYWASTGIVVRLFGGRSE